MIVWGWNTKEIGTKEIHDACKICNANRLRLVGLQRIFHICWIPIIPIGKSMYVSCSSCGSEYQSNAILQKAEQQGLSFKTPWWSFSGLVIIIAFVLFGIHENSKNDETIQNFKNHPQVGMYFTFKFPFDEELKKTPFSLGKIEEIKDNKIVIRFSNYAYSNEYKAAGAAKNSKKDSDKDLSETIEFEPQDFQKIDFQKIIDN